jgi:hypothetical protein
MLTLCIVHLQVAVKNIKIMTQMKSRISGLHVVASAVTQQWPVAVPQQWPISCTVSSLTLSGQ